MNKKNITNEGEKLSQPKTPNKIFTIPKPPPLIFTNIQPKKKLSPLPIKNLFSTTFTTQKIIKNYNQNEDVDKIKEDLNKDYYIIQTDDLTTQNDNLLLSSSRRGLFKKLTAPDEFSEKRNQSSSLFPKSMDKEFVGAPIYF